MSEFWLDVLKVIAGIITGGGGLLAILKWWSQGRTDDRTWLFDRIRTNAEEMNQALKEARTEMESIRRINVKTLMENVELKTAAVDRNIIINELKASAVERDALIVELKAQVKVLQPHQAGTDGGS